MDKEEFEEKLFLAKIREKRYQWIIATVIPAACLIIGFLCGMQMQTLLLHDQVVQNTTEIRVLKEGLGNIGDKLDRLIEKQ